MTTYDYEIIMTDYYGDELILCGYDNEGAYIKFYDPDRGYRRSLRFESVEDAMLAAEKMGFRE